jgi:hypothetical protein
MLIGWLMGVAFLCKHEGARPLFGRLLAGRMRRGSYGNLSARRFTGLDDVPDKVLDKNDIRSSYPSVGCQV